MEYLRAKIKEDIYPFIKSKKSKIYEAKDYVTTITQLIQNASQVALKNVKLQDLDTDMFLADDEQSKAIKEFFVEYSGLSVIDAMELMSGLPQIMDVAIRAELKDKTLDEMHVAETLEEQTKDVPTPPRA